MNLKYKILWLDDDESFFDSQSPTIDQLEEHIQAEGFDFELKYVKGPEEINIDTVGDEFDLIVVDYHLAEGNGGDVIRKIRDHNFFTEIIFYSSAGATKLRTVVASEELDGVFVSTKDRDSLYRKIVSIFELTIRKIVDIDNMRGLIMAGVAEIDHELIDILKLHHEAISDEQRDAHRKKIFGKLLPSPKAIKRVLSDPKHAAIVSFEKALSEVIEAEPATIDVLLSQLSFDSTKRVESVESILKEKGFEDLKGKISNIKKSLKWRNALAHQRPAIVDGKQYFDIEKDGKLTAFDSQQGKELRVEIREHRIQIANALKKLQERG